MTVPVWRNWADTESARPSLTARPRNVDELAATITDAAKQGRHAKVVGAGHSFSGIAVPDRDGVMIQLDRMNTALQVDVDSGLVTVPAGMPLDRLNALLDANGLAMSNLGDIDRQTVAGAIATGTHGTGAKLGSISTQVRGIEMVLADGSLATCSADDNAEDARGANLAELFAAARIGLGALGVVTAVTFQCEKAFALHAVEGPMRLDEVLSDLDQLVDENDHFEFFWFPHTEGTLTKRNNRVPADSPLRPLGRLRRWFDDEFLSNDVHERVLRSAARFPRLVPAANRVATRALAPRKYVDLSHRVFSSPRRVRFREAEYAVPRAAIVDLCREIKAWIDHSGEYFAYPTEVRFTASDDIWLSTAYDQETAYVSVQQYHRLAHERYLRAVEDLVAAVGGRPHWGKLHWLEAETLRHRYPRFDDFVRLRDRLDPDGIFANPYLDRVLGKPHHRTTSR